MRVSLVVNPRARRGARLGGKVEAALRARGVDVLAGEAAARPEAIVVAGGDGTFARAIPEALRLRIPIGVVPLGTFNDLARTLGIPVGVEEACAVIAAGAVRAIDAARVNGVYYVNEASVGISSRIARLQQSAGKQRFGALAIAASALRGLRYARAFRATIRWDGGSDVLETIQITVANSHRFGRVVAVAGAAIDDGRLDCYALEARGLFPVFATIAALLTHRAPGFGGLRRYAGPAIAVETEEPHRITADGEPAGTTPARFEVLPKALDVFAPREARLAVSRYPP